MKVRVRVELRVRLRVRLVELGVRLVKLGVRVKLNTLSRDFVQFRRHWEDRVD